MRKRDDDGRRDRRFPPLQLLLDFAVIGATAFGGGSPTLVAMRRLCVERRGWLNDEQYADSFVLSRLSPGINILAQVILIGRHVAGWPGILAAVAGLMAPATAITVGLSVAYRSLQGAPSAQGPLAALATVVAGFTVVLVIELGRGLLRPARLVRDVALACFCCGLALAGASPVVVLVGALAVGASLRRSPTLGIGGRNGTWHP